jgi:adenylate kinase family enzyme
VSRRLAAILGVPHIELDALHHDPNWKEASAELLRERVHAAFAVAPDGWVVDGNYHHKLGRLVVDSADTIVFLDPPFATALRRSLWRTFSRAARHVELWNGNYETFSNAFSRNSIPLWVIRTHRGMRAKMAERLPDAKVVHLRSPREVDRWLQSIQATASTSGSSSVSARQNTPPVTDT